MQNFVGNKVHLKHIIYDYRYNSRIRGSSCLKKISPLENVINFKVPLSFIGRLQIKSSSLAFLESRESQYTMQERLSHVFLGISYGKIIVFKTEILKSPGDEKRLSVFKQNATYKYEGELWLQSIQVNVPDSVIKNSMDAPESKAS